MPLAVSLMIVHCILPSHPAATAIAESLGAGIGTVILAGILVGIPAALVAGPLYVKYTVKDDMLGEMAPLEEESHILSAVEDRSLPSFGITMLTVLIPLLLMVSKTIGLLFIAEDSVTGSIIGLVGSPIVALLLSVFFAYFTLGFSRGMNREELLQLTESSLAPSRVSCLSSVREAYSTLS